jgi:hypothetical protein
MPLRRVDTDDDAPDAGPSDPPPPVPPVSDDDPEDDDPDADEDPEDDDPSWAPAGDPEMPGKVVSAATMLIAHASVAN